MTPVRKGRKPYCALGKPDVLLVDLDLPDMNTVDLLFFVVNTYQTVSIMVTTVHEDEQQVLNCIESGATGFFLKDSLSNKGDISMKIFNTLKHFVGLRCFVSNIRGAGRIPSSAEFIGWR